MQFVQQFNLLSERVLTQQQAHQLAGLGKTPSHSTLQSRRVFRQIHCVITGDLASYRDRIMRLDAGRTRFAHSCDT